MGAPAARACLPVSGPQSPARAGATLSPGAAASLSLGGRSSWRVISSRLAGPLPAFPLGRAAMVTGRSPGIGLPR